MGLGPGLDNIVIYVLAHQEEEEDPLRIDTSDCHCEMDDRPDVTVEKEIDEISRTKEILEDIESLQISTNRIISRYSSL